MQHPLITEWAREKFDLPDHIQIQVEQETRNDGYCETCWYEYEVWVVYKINGSEREVLETFRDDFASILRDIMDWAEKRIKK